MREVFDSDDVLYMLRTVQAIVTHLERFPPERAEGAGRRASDFGTFSYQGVKNILVRALDLEPLPGERPRGRAREPARPANVLRLRSRSPTRSAP